MYFANDGDTTADQVYGQFGDFTINVESNNGQGTSGLPSADNLSHPKDIAIGPKGGLYVSDTLHHRVLYFRSDGDTTADGSFGQFKNLDVGIANNDGKGSSLGPAMDNLNGPQGIIVDAAGNFYVSDTGNHRILAVECPNWEN